MGDKSIGRFRLHLRCKEEEDHRECEHRRRAELGVFSPDGKYVCISNTDSDDVSIIDVKTRREVARVKVGKVPKRLAAATIPVASGKQ